MEEWSKFSKPAETPKPIPEIKENCIHWRKGGLCKIAQPGQNPNCYHGCLLRKPKPTKKKCPYCKKMIKKSEFDKHLTACNEVIAYDSTTKEILIPISQVDKSLNFEDVINQLIQAGKSSSLSEFRTISEILTGKGHNARFQARRIKDAIRMLQDIGLKIIKK